MADPTQTPSPEKPVFVATIDVGRLWTLTIVNLTLNIVILVLIFVGAIAHHHAMMRERMIMQSGGFGGRGPGFGPPGPGAPGSNNNAPPRPPGPAGSGGPPPTTGGAGEPNYAARMTDNIMNHLDDQLALTDDEVAKIRPVVAQELADFQTQMEAHQPVTQQQIEAAKAKIRPFLEPDQQKELDAMPVPNHLPSPGGQPNPDGGA
jgi:hypothetical protein